MTSTIRIYTNDVERERLRQDAYARTQNRLSLNRHRTRRAGLRQLTVIGIVAKERGDKTLYNEVRASLELPKGAKFDETFEVVPSRRCSRARRYGFASNRVIRYQIEEIPPQDLFPLVETKALAAANDNRIV
jgi:ribosomal protein L32